MAARSKQKKSMTRTPRIRRPRQPIDWRKVISRTTSGVIVLLFAGGGVAWALGAAPLRQYIKRIEHQEESAAPLVLDLDWPQVRLPADEAESEERTVPYVGEERASRIRRDLRAIIKRDPFDQASLETAGVYLRDLGWLKAEGATVRRRPGNVIEIRGEWRQPRYVVRHSGRDYVIGDDFGLLPLSEVAGSPLFAAAGLRFIEGVYAGAPRHPLGEIAPGLLWQGTDLRAAATLLDSLRPYERIWAQIAGVKVEPGQGTAVHQLTLVTDHGSLILWGRPPGEEGSIESSTADKLKVLIAAHDRTGRIDIGEAFNDIRTGNYEIDRTSGSSGH